MNKDTLYTTGGTEVTVDGKWLHNMCRTIAREDAEAGGYEYTEAAADAIYENMSEETTQDVLKEAFTNVVASGISSEDQTIMTSISRLGLLQDKITEYECEIGREIGIKVRLQEEMYEDEDDNFEVLIGGVIYSNFLSFDEADDIVAAFVKGMQMAQVITVDTPAGKVIAGKNFDPEAPGIYMEMVPKGYGSHIDLATSEVKVSPDLRHDGESEEDLQLYVWGQYSGPNAESWTDKFDYPREGLIEALGEE